MAFEQKGMARVTIGGSVGVGAGSVKSLYLYFSNDDVATVEAANYFNDFAGQFTVGDMIMTSLSIGPAGQTRAYVVREINAGVVTVGAA